MVNYIWVGMIVIGIVYALFNGTMDLVNAAIFQGAKNAVTIAFGLISVLVFWLGLMRIAEKAGLLEALGKLCRPVVKKIFPEVPPDHPAMGYILSNTMANMFGLGNAATPLGIKAMEELKKLNHGKETASRSMITFLAVNTSSITLVPTTVIAVRITYGSANPADIVMPTLIATIISAIGALLIDRYFYHKRKRKGGA
ncbi:MULTISPECIES: nucleoside recognition domain-containing protein [Bacillaceae]|uniref:Nucleoside recognition domain-containing protein n=1 Tax=Metabacillus sediminis TaxID=3117746 RepID=A0ABZ2NCB0_9BACI|nr:nucleoside recognition domain-containing protein [Bacillus sp. SJS]KZZ86464.1 spore maturation protein [Bacillus sp. SJS]